MRQKSFSSSWSELQEEAATDQVKAEFVFPEAEGGVISLGSSILLRQMGARFVVWFQEEIKPMGVAENILESRHYWTLFVYCLPWLLEGQLSVFWECGSAMFWVNPTHGYTSVRIVESPKGSSEILGLFSFCHSDWKHYGHSVRRVRNKRCPEMK